MVTEDYVSFDLSKLLRDKGFDEKCSHLYRKDGEHLYCGYGKLTELTNTEIATATDWVKKEFECTCPTLQRAMKWLRDIHKLGVFPTTYYREMGGKVKHDYGSTIVRLDTFEIIGNSENISDYTFEADSYEETAEKAIRSCLDKLISPWERTRAISTP